MRINHPSVTKSELVETIIDLLESLGLTSRKNDQEVQEDYGTEGVRVYRRAREVLDKLPGGFYEKLNSHRRRVEYRIHRERLTDKNNS